MSSPDFSKGAVHGPGYDTSASGLGLAPTYLAPGAVATATATGTAAGMITGIVSATGTVTAGTGFSVSGGGTPYLITFDTPFAATPTVLVTPVGGPAPDDWYAANIADVSTTDFTVNMFDLANSTFQGIDFHFVAFTTV